MQTALSAHLVAAICRPPIQNCPNDARTGLFGPGVQPLGDALTLSAINYYMGIYIYSNSVLGTPVAVTGHLSSVSKLNTTLFCSLCKAQ